MTEDGTPPRTAEEVRALARQTLIDHGLYALPINPVVLAKRLGLRVHNAVFHEPRYSGLTAKRDGGTTILVKQDDAPVRKRFTIAHEIGHCLLHLSDQTTEIIDTDADLFRMGERADGAWTWERRREYEANVFASELLMPAPLISQAWSELAPAERTIARMAALLGVSKEATGYRLDELGLAE